MRRCCATCRRTCLPSSGCGAPSAPPDAMDYGRFVRTRQPLWDEFERRLAAAQRDERLDHEGLETLAFRYRQVLHDHALAAARYPDTGSARRLLALALAGTQWLQRDRGQRVPGPWAFYSRV